MVGFYYLNVFNCQEIITNHEIHEGRTNAENTNRFYKKNNYKYFIFFVFFCVNSILVPLVIKIKTIK